MHRRLLLLLMSTVTLVAGAAPAEAMPSSVLPDPSPLNSYTDPPFAQDCHFLRYGEGQRPPLSAAFRDPLCVEYAKRDITVDNGGALRFVLAEPSRFAVAAPVCRYWQIDHWSVQFDRADQAVVTWDGSYWFDRTQGTAASRLQNFRINGKPAGIEQAADAVRPYSPELADYLQPYSTGPDGGGAARLAPPSPTAFPCPRPVS